MVQAKTRMNGLQCGEGHMMTNSVVWTHNINATDRQTDSHVAIAVAALTHGVWRRQPINSLPSAMWHLDSPTVLIHLRQTDMFLLIVSHNLRCR